MFVDEASILVIGGNGGNGCCAFRREKYVDRGGPSGGDGGPGGSVIFRADEGEATLLRFRYHSQFAAQRGRHGEGSNRTGRSGEDFVVPVPLGTIVYDEDRVRLLADLAEQGQTFVAASGGRGGRGNARFKTSVRQAPTRHDPGEDGERRVLRLELKLLADVGLLGFPNAGKSTLIRRLSAARPKVADYPFTTLVPNLGVVNLGDFRTFVMADIPGLIDGASEGAGLGHRFLRHVERCRLLLHLVDAADTTRPTDERLEALDAELARYNAALAARPRIVVATKSDALDERDGIDAARAYAEAHGWEFLEISAVAGAGLDTLLHRIDDTLQRTPAIAPTRIDEPTADDENAP